MNSAPRPRVQLGPLLSVSAAAAAAAEPQPGLTNLFQPHLWYPEARTSRRRIIFHAGPTNSGKTHAALECLKRASAGAYCAPLRLLAWEVYERMNESGVTTALLTGQEREGADDCAHLSCTVEMMDTSSVYDVVVLDEIQMISDRERGWAWSRVLLGANAKELHVCGDAAAVPLLRRLVALTGDDLSVTEYTRLSPLVVSPTPLRSLADVRVGDAVVCFSRFDLFSTKHEIETTTGLRCGVIYGALPPGVRREEARRFNGASDSSSSSSSSDSESTQVLCATDAIGMGLNLAIRRIVFSRTEKFDGVGRRRLNISEMKQIGGRAGRFGGVHATGGEISSLRAACLPLLSRALASPTPAVRSAGLMPTLEQLETFAASMLPAWRDVDEWEEEEAEEEDGDAAAAAASSATRAAAASHDGGSHHPRVASVSVSGASRASIRSRADAALQTLTFSVVLEAFVDAVTIDASTFFLCDLSEMIEIARLIDDVQLPLRVRFAFCSAPVDVSQPLQATALRRYAARYARAGRVRLGLRPPKDTPSTPAELGDLEQAHAVFDLYTWLSRRFPSEFVDAEAASDATAAVQGLITAGLRRMGDVAVREGVRAARMLRRRQQRLAWMNIIIQQRHQHVHRTRQIHEKTSFSSTNRSTATRVTRAHHCTTLISSLFPSAAAPLPHPVIIIAPSTSTVTSRVGIREGEGGTARSPRVIPVTAAASTALCNAGVGRGMSGVRTALLLSLLVHEHAA